MSTSSFVFLGVSGGGVGGQERSIRLAYLDDATSVCYGTVTFVRQCVVTMRRQGGMRRQGAMRESSDNVSSGGNASSAGNASSGNVSSGGGGVIANLSSECVVSVSAKSHTQAACAL